MAKRTKSFKLRLSEDEFTEINSRVPNGEVRAEWIRRILLDEEKPRTRKRLSTPKINPSLMSALGQIGNNINQIGRAVNTAKKSNQDFLSIELLNALVKIEKQLDRIRTENVR